ncbi:RraA family protein [candidate division KSB3 bacterium]|jgi:regulator of RNase E activity RraA|uniref:Regulator of ribonuclease activity homolog n=1 Tax=candidate division KSB3 bacterium TaxID=2044937 RepID=A0A9D5JZY9_9BACT|nr:RraA family protein [candidate division KSB3 bacterium]MBD3327066.1 RraA family protein [candidate division KSB3 bacterium]
MSRLTPAQLEELREFDSPTVSNAIEFFDIRPRTEGFMGPEIKCILPYRKPMIGYACTATISSLEPPTPEQKALVYDYYANVKQAPTPTVVVIQDLDPVPIGSFWGEVHASIHKALGCVGVITNGGVRDLDEVRALEFGYFASCVLVSHAYDHIEDYDCPVQVGGLTIQPGDLLHADQHGVVLIPPEIAPELAAACRQAHYAEEPVIQGCRTKFESGVSLEELRQWREEMQRRRTV